MPHTTTYSDRNDHEPMKVSGHAGDSAADSVNVLDYRNDDTNATHSLKYADIDANSNSLDEEERMKANGNSFNIGTNNAYNNNNNYERSNSDRCVRFYIGNDTTNPKEDSTEGRNSNRYNYVYNHTDAPNVNVVDSGDISVEASSSQMHMKDNTEKSRDQDSTRRSPPKAPKTAFMCFCAEAKDLNSWEVRRNLFILVFFV